MRAKASPLRLELFELLQSHYQFIVPEEEIIEDVQQLFNTYPVDIDFRHDELEDNHIHVRCIIEVNAGKKPKGGYTMLAEASGIFSITDAKGLDKATLANLRLYSTLNMMINNLRNVMFQQSNIGPMEGYLLPPIDVMDLFEKKNKETKTRKKSK